MKNNKKMKIKNEMKNNNKIKNNNKNLPKGSLKQSTIAGSFCPIKKNDYRSDIVFHLVAISTFNRSND